MKDLHRWKVYQVANGWIIVRGVVPDGGVNFKNTNNDDNWPPARPNMFVFNSPSDAAAWLAEDMARVEALSSGEGDEP